MTVCGLSISTPKTKLLVVGSCVVQNDLDPIVVANDFIMFTASFCYLGTLVESHGGVQMELSPRISCTGSQCFWRSQKVCEHMLSI